MVGKQNFMERCGLTFDQLAVDYAMAEEARSSPFACAMT